MHLNKLIGDILLNDNLYYVINQNRDNYGLNWVN